LLNASSEQEENIGVFRELLCRKSDQDRTDVCRDIPVRNLGRNVRRLNLLV
jgi:hypothetical protein